MKKLQHILPCGRVYFWYQTTPKDFAEKPPIRKLLTKYRKNLDPFVSYDGEGRKPKKWRRRVMSKFATLLMSKMVDHLMESDRVETAPGVMWMIAGVPERDGKYLNWNTDGLVYGVVAKGIPGKIRISMSGRRRKELKKRIEEGQNFHIL